MKILNGLAAIGTLLLITALPVAGQTISQRAPGAPTQLTAAGEFSAKKDEYVQRSRNEMREWQRKMQNFSRKADAKAHEAGAAGMSRLREAWAKTQAESRVLESTSADGWQSAKNSFEKASRNLKDAWHKIHPEDE